MTDFNDQQALRIQYTELETVADAIKRASSENNDELSRMLASNPGIIARFFPNQFQRQQQKSTLDQAQQVANNHFKRMELLFSIRLELLKIDGNFLVVIKDNVRQKELAKIVTENIGEFEMTIKKSRENFMEKMKPHLDSIETYRDYPLLYNSAIKSVETQINNYMNTIDQMLFDFKESLRSKIRHKASSL